MLLVTITLHMEVSVNIPLSHVSLVITWSHVLITSPTDILLKIYRFLDSLDFVKIYLRYHILWAPVSQRVVFLLIEELEENIWAFNSLHQKMLPFFYASQPIKTHLLSTMFNNSKANRKGLPTFSRLLKNAIVFLYWSTSK